MLGIEPHQLISFLRQIGLACAGASSLWGLCFMYLALSLLHMLQLGMLYLPGWRFSLYCLSKLMKA